ncbi:hypothetical protein EJ02DRAFT_434522 [Clathrospora elynae]|uniref:Uncharacterized protein n=1 Tax=Clathrospora elynae TaxID=706981 RepID=A0A6A5SMJ8_9PLEO|nr:hypothetical protein EJ02DRAFT_434522 [Clathrospora elynae]
MSGLGSSRWASEPSSNSSAKDAKTKKDDVNVAVTSFGFTIPAFNPVNKLAPVVSTSSAQAATMRLTAALGFPLSASPIKVEMKQPIKIETEQPASSPAPASPVQVEMMKPLSKADIVVAATRDQIAKFEGRGRRQLPLTVLEMIGKGLSASYGGYVKKG